MIKTMLSFQRKVVLKYPLLSAYLGFVKGVVVTVFVYEVLLS